MAPRDPIGDILAKLGKWATPLVVGVLVLTCAAIVYFSWPYVRNLPDEILVEGTLDLLGCGAIWVIAWLIGRIGGDSHPHRPPSHGS